MKTFLLHIGQHIIIIIIIRPTCVARIVALAPRPRLTALHAKTRLEKSENLSRFCSSQLLCGRPDLYASIISMWIAVVVPVRRRRGSAGLDLPKQPTHIYLQWLKWEGTRRKGPYKATNCPNLLSSCRNLGLWLPERLESWDSVVCWWLISTRPYGVCHYLQLICITITDVLLHYHNWYSHFLSILHSRSTVIKFRGPRSCKLTGPPIMYMGI